MKKKKKKNHSPPQFIATLRVYWGSAYFTEIENFLLKIL